MKTKLDDPLDRFGSERHARNFPERVMRVLERPIAKNAWAREIGARNGVSRSAPETQTKKPVEDAGPWEPAVQEIISYQHLGDNWDGYGALAPSREVLESAIGLAYTYYQDG